jgi:hypothetical protein
METNNKKESEIMRSIKKHLTVVNRGNYDENKTAFNKVCDRYIAKMQKNGWNHDYTSCGDEFLKFGGYVHLYK